MQQGFEFMRLDPCALAPAKPRPKAPKLDGAAKRDVGIARVKKNREEWVLSARSVAVEVAMSLGVVTINDVRDRVALPDDYPDNIWGAVLRGKDFVPCGYTQATHPSAHARVVRIYKLRKSDAE